MPQRYLIYAAIAVAAGFIQKFLFARLAIGGDALGMTSRLQPDLILVLLVYLARTEGQLTGTTSGFLSGLLMDFLSGTLGANAFSKTISGFVAGYFSDAEQRDNQTAFLVALAVSSFTGNFFYYLLMSALTIPIWKLLLIYAFGGAIYNVLIGFVLFHALLKRL